MQAELAGLYDPEEIRSMWFVLIEAFLGWTVMETLQKEEDVLTESEMLKFHFAVKDLKIFKPIQYITGYTWFYSLKIEVGPGVLIPRPETEELVQWVIHEVNDREEKAIDLLDVGTGSGCIALALAANLPEARITAMDVSEEALKIATENAEQNKLYLSFHQADIRDETRWGNTFYDVIVSNPPYVRESEKALMSDNVLKYEPEQALFVSDDDPLVFYRAILRFAQTHLKPGGCVYFEINENLSHEMNTLADLSGFQETELRQDLNGKNRMFKCAR